MTKLSAAKIADIGLEQQERRAKQLAKRTRLGKGFDNKKGGSQPKKPDPAAKKKEGATPQNTLTELDLSNREISDGGELNFFTELQRLDLSNNQLDSLDGVGVAKLPACCHRTYQNRRRCQPGNTAGHGDRWGPTST